MGSTVDRLLDEARSSIARLTAAEALAAQKDGALLVDIRTERQREATGAPAGSLPIDPTILLWRLDPTSEWAIPESRAGRRVVVLCQQGYSSSLAAWALGQLGTFDVGDLIGGFDSWLEDGLPVAQTLPARIH